MGFGSIRHVVDAVQMMLEGKQPVYNVGGATTIRITELAARVGRILGVTVTLPEEQRPSDGASDSVMIDMGRYETDFGDPSYVDLDSGLRRTVEWHALLAEVDGIAPAHDAGALEGRGDTRWRN